MWVQKMSNRTGPGLPTFLNTLCSRDPNMWRGEILLNMSPMLEVSIMPGLLSTRPYIMRSSRQTSLNLGLWLESDRLLQLRIDSVGVETQRNVIKEERRQRFR